MTKQSVQWRMVLLIFFCLALLPLLALIYVSILHLHDPERVRFPIAVGEILLTFSLLVHLSKHHSNIVNRLNGTTIVLVLAVTSALTAFAVRKDDVLQQEVITQASSIVKDYKPKTLVVRDMTGTLGDVYSLYQTVLQDALFVDANENISAIICTPLSVDRLHPIANRFQIASTPRCEDLSQLKGQKAPGLLVTHWNNGSLQVDAAQ
jgi:hypothetical protein